jgi:hypothetical protein
MARILVHVEGQTEETFVNEVLLPHLDQFRHSASARLVGNARQKTRRGGIRGWDTVSKDIIRHLLSDPACYATTMVDYYALPQGGTGAWPGRATASLKQFASKSSTVQQALLEDIIHSMGVSFNPSRFIPYVIMHEFEGILFSHCQRFANGIARPDLAPKFQTIRDAFTSPEEINDSPITAPSKRVISLVPEYEKPIHGNLAVLEIGLNTIRAECPLFNHWITILETLPP